LCTFAGVLLGGHVRAVFSLVLIIFIICVTITLTSFKEIPLDILTAPGIRVSSAPLNNFA
jgi:solute carrier family 45 protein 1/2/4